MLVNLVRRAGRIHVRPAAGDVEDAVADPQVTEKVVDSRIDSGGHITGFVQLLQGLVRLPALAQP